MTETKIRPRLKARKNGEENEEREFRSNWRRTAEKVSQEAGLAELPVEEIRRTAPVPPWMTTDEMMNNITWDVTLTSVLKKADEAEEKRGKCQEALETMEEPDWEIWTDGSVKEGTGCGGGGGYVKTREGETTEFKVAFQGGAHGTGRGVTNSEKAH